MKKIALLLLAVVLVLALAGCAARTYSADPYNPSYYEDGTYPYDTTSPYVSAYPYTTTSPRNDLAGNNEGIYNNGNAANAIG